MLSLGLSKVIFTNHGIKLKRFYCMSKHNAETIFIIISNGRCGSSHLVTSLSRFDDVSCDYEIKWEIFYKKRNVHLVMFQGDRVIDIIDSNINKNKIMGSKFIFDSYPQSIIGVEKERHLVNSFDENISIIHLTRSYFDILISTFYRGSVHLLSDRGNDSGQVVVQDAVKSELDLPECKWSIPTNMIPLVVMNMFHSDMLALEIATRAKKSMVMPYAEINTRMKDVAEFIGSQTSDAKIKEITDQPVIRKLPPIDLSQIDKVDDLQSWISRFDTAREHYLLNGIPETGQPLVFHIVEKDKKSIEVTDSYLRTLFS